MKLRNAHLAIVDRSKVLDYLLNEGYPDNGGKARFFASLGCSREDPEGLMRALRNVAAHGEVVSRGESVYGENMLLMAGCRRTLKRTAGGRSGRYGSSTAAGMRRAS